MECCGELVLQRERNVLFWQHHTLAKSKLQLTFYISYFQSSFYCNFFPHVMFHLHIATEKESALEIFGIFRHLNCYHKSKSHNRRWMQQLLPHCSTSVLKSECTELFGQINNEQKLKYHRFRAQCIEVNQNCPLFFQNTLGCNLWLFSSCHTSSCTFPIVSWSRIA